MGDVKQQEEAVEWLRVQTAAGAGPAFMYSNHTKCQLILRHIDALQAHLAEAQKELRKHLYSSVEYDLVDGIRKLAQAVLTSTDNVETLVKQLARAREDNNRLRILVERVKQDANGDVADAMKERDQYRQELAEAKYALGYARSELQLLGRDLEELNSGQRHYPTALLDPKCIEAIDAVLKPTTAQTRREGVRDE